MKVNYRTHPILRDVNDRELHLSTISRLDKDYFDRLENRVRFKQIFFKLNTLCNSKIEVISLPFLEAVQLSSNKLRPLIKDQIISENLKIRGCYIISSSLILIDSYMEHNFSSLESIGFLKDGRPLFCISIGGSKDGEVSNNYSWYSKDLHGEGEHLFKMALEAITDIVFFKKYANIEIKHLEPKSKLREIGCKYLNETDLSIDYLDSKWFTTLVKSDGFKVRGHFRLQPKKKDGKWTHELIYIDEFMKTGYTAPARKLNNL